MTLPAEFVVTEHQWNAEAQVRAQRAVWRHTTSGRLLTWIGRAVVAAAAAIILWIVITADRPAGQLLVAVGPWIIIFALWIVLLRGGAKFVAKLNARQLMPDLTQPLRDSFDDSGYVRRQGGTEARVAWSAMKRAVETRDEFLIFYTPACAYYVPKAGLGAGDVSRLREAFVAKLGAGFARENDA